MPGHLLHSHLWQYLCILAEHCASGLQAYFGSGTKLTVLEHEVAVPKVEILPPSTQEIREKKRVTLVCVATGFYPDHVTVTWMINGKVETKRTKTDNSASWSGPTKNYSISSRLRLPVKQWFNTKNRFLCEVGFFNGNTTINVTDSIQGAQYCGLSAEQNQRNGNAAEFSYILLLGKSALFAAFLMIFVFKLKGSVVKKDIH
ncbi:hypothetical protein MATL_G00138120 [Megalops atlanticus]|uniref:Ig-like domain-containing protein n=1 Tax=Megalops atlanticus TaxID=7932 RepID=A0A9D3PT27_MEGAT|nr:hypothetical protein MATL_G00138120 [Megalops atlanticus]